MKLTIRDKKTVGPDGGWVVTRTYLVDGRGVSAEEWDRLYQEQMPKVDLPDEVVTKRESRERAYPYASDAMGVHPDQIPLARELDKKKNAPSTEYTKSGEPIFTSAAHRAGFLKAHRFHDRNSFYGH